MKGSQLWSRKWITALKEASERLLKKCVIGSNAYETARRTVDGNRGNYRARRAHAVVDFVRPPAQSLFRTAARSCLARRRGRHRRDDALGGAAFYYSAQDQWPAHGARE